MAQHGDSQTEIDGEDSQSYNLYSQDTMKHLLDSINADPTMGDVFKKVINHGSFTFSSSSDTESTKCEVTLDTYYPNQTAQTYAPMSMSYYMSARGPTYIPSDTIITSPSTVDSCSFTNQQFTNFSGQVPEEYDHSTMTYPDTPVQQPPPAASPNPMSLMPSMQNFSGHFNFKLEFGKPPKDTKSANWTYSAIVNKLFVQKDALCPVQFSINGNGIANGLYIRALPVYSRPEHLQDVVKRCPNHIYAPETAMIPHRDHFIWCENQSANYVQDPVTSRYAVVVPYDIPPAGTNLVTYLFSFKCLNSCVGGPNRREISVIFTLEDGSGGVLGRQCIDLRICACPGRDRKTEEKKLEQNKKPNTSQSIPKEITNTPPSAPLQMPNQANGAIYQTDILSVGRRRKSNSEVFTLTVKGRKNYEILTSIRDSLEMSEMVPVDERERFTKERRQNDHQHSSMQNTQPSTLPRMSTAFSFTSSRPFSLKQDVVHSTQRGVDMTDGAAPSPTLSSTTAATSTSSSTVAEWLKDLGLGAYIDNFHNVGLYSMDQLKSERNFTINDLENMKLTKPTVTKIWTSLKGYRSDTNPARDPAVVTLKRESAALPDSQGSQLSSQGSSVSLSNLTSQTFRPGLLEFTKCSVKITVEKKKRKPSDEPCDSNSQQHKKSKSDDTEEATQSAEEKTI